MRKNSLFYFFTNYQTFHYETIIYYLSKQENARSVKVLLSRTAIYKLAEQCPKSLGQHCLIVTETRLPAYEGTNIIKGP